MIFQEVNWIRSNIDKLCPDLKKHALNWYRPFRRIPCFMQKYVKGAKQRLHKVPVIVQVLPEHELEGCFINVAKKRSRKAPYELPIIHSFSAKVNAKTLEKLAGDERIIKIWYDRPVKAVLDIATPAVKAPAVWGRGISGKGVGVAVLDTGIYKHPDLSGRITGFVDFIGNKKSAYDDNGHGTHVAGDIASSGSRSSASYTGPAKEANLIGVKVLDRNGSGSLSTVIKGIQWCIANKDAYGIRVINLSLGSTATLTCSKDPVCQAVEMAWNKGIVVCAAAGNEGPNPGTISSPGIDPVIITVGAIDDKNSVNSNDYEVANYSSRGPTIDQLTKPDVLCPGSNIISLRSPKSTIGRQNKGSKFMGDYISLSGTSMATPVCAGIVALMLEADNTLTPDEVKTKLKQSARPLPNVEENAQGSGVVDAEKAIQSQAKN